MIQVCPRCQRANPRPAVYCYHDGAVLNPATAPVGLLVRPVVLPLGVLCRSVEDLASGLAQAWPDARVMLADGSLTSLLRESGRLDLARAADDSRALPDLDLGLYQFLGRLPAATGPMPKLEVYPRRLVLGPYPAGGQHRSNLSVSNRGAGVLQGKVQIVEGSWLRLDEASDRRAVPIQTDGTQNVALWVDTRGLASGQVYPSKLIVVSGGGLAEVPVSLEITAVAYPAKPFRAATTARQLAELMRRHPRDAAEALERGEVVRWFATNGWAYPVVGPTASGLAGVQQLFEALGLARPPQLELTPNVIDLHSERGRAARGEVTLRTPGKKWVYAQVESSAPWLRIAQPAISGPQQATVAFEVEPAGLPEGVSEGEVRVTANGGTRLKARVRVEVRRPVRPGLPDWTRALLVGGLCLLLYRALAILPADLFARLAGDVPEAGTLAGWLSVPGTKDAFLGRFVLATFWLGFPLGFALAWRLDGTWLDRLGGVVAGGAAGLAIAATLGCLLILGDTLPRTVLGVLTGAKAELPVIVATTLWLFLACGSWLVMGVLLGLIELVVARLGLSPLAVLAAPIRGLGDLVGTKGLKEWVRF